MKKQFLFPLFLTLTLILAACGNDTKEASSETEEDTHYNRFSVRAFDDNG